MKTTYCLLGLIAVCGCGERGPDKYTRSRIDALEIQIGQRSAEIQELRRVVASVATNQCSLDKRLTEVAAIASTPTVHLDWGHEILSEHEHNPRESIWQANFQNWT